MDFGTLGQWACALGAFLSACLSFFVLRQNKSRDVKNDLSQAVEQIHAVEIALKAVEAERAHFPDLGMMHRLELSIMELRGDVRRVSEALSPMAAITNRLQEYLFEAKR